jgi:hypothetical protein
LKLDLLGVLSPKVVRLMTVEAEKKFMYEELEKQILWWAAIRNV